MPENEYDQTYYGGELNPSYVTASPATKEGQRKLRRARGRAQVAQAIQTYMTDSKLPKSVLSERARNGDPNAYLSLTAQGRDEDTKRTLRFGAGMLGTGALAALGAAAVPVVEGIAAGTSTIPVVLGNAGRMLGNGLGKVGEYISPVFNNPVAKFYFSRPVQAMQGVVTAAPKVYNWVKNGEKPSTSEAVSWGLGTGLGVALGGNWGEASKAAYEIPGYLKGIKNFYRKEFLTDVFPEIFKGLSRYYPNEVQNIINKYPIHTDLSGNPIGLRSNALSKIQRYLYSVSPKEQVRFNKLFTPEKLKEILNANKENFRMRLWEGAPDEAKEYFKSHPGSFDKVADSYTSRFNFNIRPFTRFERFAHPKRWGVENYGKYPKNVTNPYTRNYDEFLGWRIEHSDPYIGVRVKGRSDNQIFNTAMHELHHASDDIATNMREIALFKNFKNRYFYPGTNTITHYYRPSFNSVNHASPGAKFDQLTGHASEPVYLYQGHDYINTPGEVRARMAGYAFTHSTPENKLFARPFADWNKGNQVGFILHDRLVYPKNFPMNMSGIGKNIEALKEYPGTFNKQGGKLIKRK